MPGRAGCAAAARAAGWVLNSGAVSGRCIGGSRFSSSARRAAAAAACCCCSLCACAPVRDSQQHETRSTMPRWRGFSVDSVPHGKPSVHSLLVRSRQVHDILHMRHWKKSKQSHLQLHLLLRRQLHWRHRTRQRRRGGPHSGRRHHGHPGRPQRRLLLLLILRLLARLHRRCRPIAEVYGRQDFRIHLLAALQSFETGMSQLVISCALKQEARHTHTHANTKDTFCK